MSTEGAFSFVIDNAGDENIEIPVVENSQPDHKIDSSLIQQLLASLESTAESSSSTTSKAEPTKPKKEKENLFKEYLQRLDTKGIKNGANAQQKFNPKAKKVLAIGEKDRKTKVAELMKKSVLTPEFEKLHAVPTYDVSAKKLRDERRKEREKSKEKWFGMKAPEVTEEIKKDLEVLQMRSVLDPKHFYKKNDLKVLPKYFQIGKVMDSPLDFYNNRLTKKERKRTIVDELLADADFQRYNKKKYVEIIDEKSKKDYKLFRKSGKSKKAKGNL